MGPLLEALRAQGAAFEPAGATSLPVTVVAGGLAGGTVSLPGDVSSQFVSALLMAAPLARDTSRRSPSTASSAGPTST